jgi:uncharacterized protein YndB with AHSA1/START domain
VTRRPEIVAEPDKPTKRPELRISRTFDAPRHMVFEAWTKAEHVARWFTPKPLTTSLCEVDFRPGGAFRVTMRMPDGVEHAMNATFVEIVAPERIVFSGKIPDDNEVKTTVISPRRAGRPRSMSTRRSRSNRTRHAGRKWDGRPRSISSASTWRRNSSSGWRKRRPSEIVWPNVDPGGCGST